ncbi:MAG: cyclic pyranopterin monophosphate synthase MoaC [Rudaea sp.]
MKRVPAIAKTKPVRVRAKTKLTHVGQDGRPKMVDVAEKKVTARSAMAMAIVQFPPAIARDLRESGMRAKKGPIIDTAIIAGTMAVKRTYDLIPFCHPLAIERCDFSIDFDSPSELAIRCEVAVTGKTGVEMEALTGATVAALTVYDMCKALSHEIVIVEVRLLDKSGGRRNVRGGKIVL